MKKISAFPPQKIIQKVQALKSGRANFESTWQGIADYIIPRKNDIQNTQYPGQPKYADIFDATGMTSLELLAGALHGMLTNPSGYFFNLTTGKPELDDNDSVRRWIQAVVRTMHYHLNNSNFQTEVQEFYLDLAGFGTGDMSVEEDDEEIIRFGSRPLKEIFIEENSKGRVDSVYRLYEMDARGLVDDFGYENVPEKVQKKYNEGDCKKYECIHALYPLRRVDVKMKSIFKVVSQYILVEDKINLEVDGFKELPHVVSRWSKASGEVYGRGPGEKALPEVKTANKITETTLRSGQKIVDPPLQAPDDGFVIPLITKPGGINYYRAGSQDRIEPIFNNAQVDFGFEMIQAIQTKIREAFYIDQLKLREGPQMTATEVMERTEQALRFLGPMLGRQQSEFLQPLIERVYNILDRKGLIPEAPAELKDVPLKVQYSSVMAMAQRLSEVQNIQRTMQSVAPFASADPSVFDNFDGDKATHVLARLFNFPQEILRNKEEVAKIRTQRAEQQQQMLQQQQENERADAASKVVSASSKIQKAV